MVLLFLIIYLGFCVLVANAAKRVAIGFWGVLVLSIILTPLVTAILAVIFKPRQEKSTRKKEYWEDEF